MVQKRQEQKVVMLSILGICFGFLGWSNVVSDFVYKKFSQVENIVLIISIIGFIHSAICVASNLIVLKISNKNPKKLFRGLLLICSIIVLMVGIVNFTTNIYVFLILYIIFMAFIEMMSMYHFAFETTATDNKRYIPVENKRKTLFRIIESISIVVSNILIVKYFELGFLVTTIIACVTFLFTYFNLRSVICRQANKKDKKETFLEKLRISKYSNRIKKYALSTIITRFALSNIVILFSMNLLENNIEFSLLKEIKNYAVIFTIIAYFIVKKANTKGVEIKTTIFIEILTILIILLSVWNPFFLIVLMGAYTIHNLVELTGRFKIFESDTYQEKNIEKNAIIDVGIFAAQGLSSLVFLNIPFNVSIVIILILIIISIILKVKCEK